MVDLKRICAVLLLACLLLTACTADRTAEREFFAMDTLMHVKIWGSDAAADAVQQEVYRLEKLLSVTENSSDVALLNCGGYKHIADETNELLHSALAISARTDGAFDPTVYPLVHLWGFTGGTQRVPSQDELQAALSHVGIENVDAQDGFAELKNGAQLDFGGIAKGYAAERCSSILQASGVEAALLTLGGNVQAVGTKPDGTPWAIGIADPAQPEQSLATLRFTGSLALVTSGGYQRYFEENGVRYHHILDPQTGMPAQSGLACVTVLAQSGTLADALSTALFVMGLDKATEFWRASDDFEAVFIMDNGEIYATAGAAELLDDCEFQVIAR